MPYKAQAGLAMTGMRSFLRSTERPGNYWKARKAGMTLRRMYLSKSLMQPSFTRHAVKA